nr:hypothetical protein [Akkermansiaceae bacterium]
TLCAAQEPESPAAPPPPAKALPDGAADAVNESIARAEYDDARTRYEYQLDLLRQLQAKLAETEMTQKGPEKPQTEAEREAFERGMAELRRQIRIQQETVEQERKLLQQIVRARGIMSKAGTPDKEGMESAALEQTVAQLRQTIQTLLRFDGDELIAFAAGLGMAEGAVRTLHPRYVALKAELEGLKNKGLGHEHPLMIAKNKELEAIRKQLEAGIVALRDSLQAKLHLAEAKLADFKAKQQADANDAAHKADTPAVPDDIRQRLDRIERMLEEVLRRLDQKPAEAPPQ